LKWINYHHLIYFKEIAKQESITKAAEVLSVGQPALSTQLKQLEEYLGEKLFERKNKRLILTSAGKVALDYANQINTLGQELLQVFDSKVFTNQVHLKIGALDNIPKNLITDLVEVAHKKTNCYYSIYEGSKSELLRQLSTHEVDIIISDHPVSKQDISSIYSKKITSLSLSAYASSKYAKLKKNFPASLNQAPCIVPTSHSKIRSDIESFFYNLKVTPRLVGETQDTALQKLLATKGQGVIFLPDFAAKPLVAKKELIKLGRIKELTVDYYLIYTKKVIENPAVEAMLNQ
jgi:LysR family transcriptional regulator, transcriptional activator of nhaA